MKPTKTYLQGKSVFMISLMVIVVTALTVYFSGVHYNRSITTNFYISLGIIAVALFVFLSYGLYKGIEMEDDYPYLKGFDFKKSIKEKLATGNFVSGAGDVSGDGISGIIFSIVLWIVFSIVLSFLLIVLQTVVWFSILLMLAMLYWVFFRAMRLVFSKGTETIRNLQKSIIYAFGYTIFYVGWLFGIVYLTTLFK